MKTAEAVRAGLAAATLVILATACGREKGTAARNGTAAPDSGGIAVLAESQDMTPPLAILPVDEFTVNLGDILYMGLLRGSWGDGQTVFQTAAESSMALARSYEYLAPDSTALRFHMRTDARWSDGQPITAQDVVFTYDVLKDPKAESPRVNFTEYMDSVVAANDSTVTFYYSHRYAEMLPHALHGIIPKHVYENVDRSDLKSDSSVLYPEHGRLVVSGPFVIDDWQRGQQVALARNPYFTPRARLDRIVFRIIPDPTTRLVELRTGGVDMIKSIAFDQIPNLKASAPNVRLEREPKRFVELIAWNTRDPLFASADVRRALGLAINVPGIIQALQMSDYAVPAAGPYPPIYTELYDPSGMQPLGYDTVRAKQLLEASGWHDSNGDGIREKDGRPFRFVLLANSGNQRRADEQQIIQQQLRKIGVDVQIRQIDFNTLGAKVIGQHDYQATIWGWGVALSPDFPNQLFSQGSQLNFTGYSNPKTEALFQKALSQPTAEQAVPYWRQAVQLVNQDQPYTWLYYNDVVDGVNDRLHDVKVDTYGPYQNTWEWWIPKSEQRTPAAPVAQGDSAK